MRQLYANKSGLPDTIDGWLRTDRYERNMEADVSVTELCNPQFQRYMRKKHLTGIHTGTEEPPPEIIADSVGLWPSTLGTSAHESLAKYAATLDYMKSETKLFGNVCGVKVAGTCDLFDARINTVIDFKTGKTWTDKYLFKYGWDKPGGAYYEWQLQLSLYARLWELQGQLVSNHGQIWLAMNDWVKSAAERDASYPSRFLQVYYVPLLQGAALDIEIKLRLEEYAKYEKGSTAVLTPSCAEGERWSKDDKWALQKDGRKTALKLFATLAEGMEYAMAKGHAEIGLARWPELKPGFSWRFKELSDRRCNDYCDVSHYCLHHQKEKAGKGQKTAAWFNEQYAELTVLEPNSSNGQGSEEPIIY